MIDLLLIRPNDQKAIYTGALSNIACEPPFWIATMAAYAIEKGYSVEVLDAEAYNESPEVTINKIIEKSPKVVGILVTGTNLSASTQKMHGASILAKGIKEKYSTMVFMWGLHPSSLPEKTLEEGVDFVIKGEGFKSVCQLTNLLKKNIMIENDKYKKIKGLYFISNNLIYKNDEIDILPLDEMPIPAWELLPMGAYKAHNWHTLGEPGGMKDSVGRYGVIATTLGCPFTCSFCAVSSLFGQHKVRYKRPEKVLQEIEVLVKNYNVKFIKIIDECFVLNKSYVIEICDLLIEKKWDLNIWAYARIDTVDEEILTKLYKAGIRWIAYGIESASEEVMGKVQKGEFNLNKTRNVISLTKKTGINVLGNFMFGLPNDDKQSMEKTLTFAKEINPEWVNFNVTMAYPGSELYQQCVKEKITLPDSWLGYAQLSYECMPLPTKHLTSKEVLEFRDYAFNAFFEDNEKYFDLIENKFGIEGVKIISAMVSKKLKRKILNG